MSVVELENLITRLAEMDRPALLETLRTFPAPFPLDFTDDYLAALPVERLQHLLFAAAYQTRRHG